MRRYLAARNRLLSFARNEVAQRAAPRLEMALLLSVSGLAALLVSYVSLRLGVRSMAMRYPLAALGGYVVFLFLLRMWVKLRNRDLEDAADLAFDVADETLAEPASALSVASPATVPDMGPASDSSGWDADDLVFVAILIGLAVSLCVVLGFVLAEAPALFAEAIVESAILASVYKRVGHTGESIWVQRIVALTWKSFALIVLLVAGFGWAAQHLAPAENTLGDVLHTLTAS